MSYLIKDGQLIAATSKALKSGDMVRVAYDTVKEEIDANREYNLLNGFDCKVSNAKKWEKEFNNSECGYSSEINEGEFLA
jgi:hypothetical protein